MGRCEVILLKIGQQKINVIKAVRAITRLGLKEAKELVDAAPKAIKEGVSQSEADEIKAQLEEVGATVVIKGSMLIIDFKKRIIDLLIEKDRKMPPSDIDAFLKHQNLDEIKELCEQMYQDGEISYAGNGRYFILTEESEKKEKTAKAKKSEAVDVKSELKKYKEMMDEGLITQEDYDAKKKELLGL